MKHKTFKGFSAVLLESKINTYYINNVNINSSELEQSKCHVSKFSVDGDHLKIIPNQPCDGFKVNHFVVKKRLVIVAKSLSLFL